MSMYPAASSAPSGAAGGELSGNYPNPTLSGAHAGAFAATGQLSGGTLATTSDATIGRHLTAAAGYVQAGTGIYLDGGDLNLRTNAAKLLLGFAADTNLYRDIAGRLATDSTFFIERGSAANQIGIAGGVISFRAAGDTQITSPTNGILQLDKLRMKAGNEQTTVGAAGGASALPLTPTKYLRVQFSDGTEGVVPAYAQA